MMKKALTILLATALTASLSLTAFADTAIDQDSKSKTGSTEVTFVVNPTYEVTIPSEVTLNYDNASASYKGSGTISTGPVRLGKDAEITVTVQSKFELYSREGATLPYEVKAGDSQAALESGDTVATFGTSTEAQSVELHYSAANPEFAGQYRDRLTFTISAPAINVMD